MFNGCTSLRHCVVDLSRLTKYSAYAASSMFRGCKLDKASVESIVGTLPTPSTVRDITIGYDSTEITQEEEDAYNTTLVGKNW